MKLLLTERGQIIAISNLIEYGVWGNIGESKSWKLGEHSYTMDDNYTVVEVDNNDIPLYVKPYEFYYIDGEFKVADECPNEYRDRIAELEAQNITLGEQIANTELTMIENYEAQEEVNAQTENALIEIYEMMEG